MPVTSAIPSKYDPPDDIHSVGWTTARKMVLTDAEHPFVTVHNQIIKHVEVEYEIYGEIEDSGANVILITHALSGDAHVAGWDSQTKYNGRVWRNSKPGWWDKIIGPAKPIDTNRFCVICANVLGSCYGTTGPSSINPDTGKPYGLTFPIVTIRDWVNMEKQLLDKLQIEKLYAVIGGSLGGQQALEWSLAYPEFVNKCIILAAGPKLPTQGLGFNAVARHAIMHDANFKNGDYYNCEKQPIDGLGVARMLAHITYLSGKGMDKKFSRTYSPNLSFGNDFEVESYLSHQSKTFVARFDANSYLYITRAMDYFDAATEWGNGDLGVAFSRIKAEVMVICFSTDWLYPPEDSKEFVNALLKNNLPVTSMEIKSLAGHDAFLVETEPVGRAINSFLLSQSRYRKR